jgi:glycosyltransferase involved in cell wall biosynthesis
MLVPQNILQKPAPDVPVDSKRTFRLAVVFPRPQPYFCKFFQKLAAHPAIDLTVYFYSDLGMGGSLDPGYSLPLEWDVDMWGGYKHRLPRNYSPWPDLSRFAGTFHPSLLWELNNRRYDVVLMQGWWGITTLSTLAALFLRRVPVLMYSDKNTFEWPSGWRQYPRNRMLQLICRRVRAILTIGQRNADFYRGVGVPDSKMFLAPLAVDNDFYGTEKRRLLPQLASLRQRIGVPEDAVLICSVGRLLPTKGLLHMVQAFATLREESAHLAIAGEGPYRAELENFVTSHRVPRVHFLGFQNYTQLPACYAASDLFVMPSYRESWGVVINEAMNFALPIIASRDAGAVADLVDHGVNGLLFDYGDVEGLAAHLDHLVSRPDERRRMGEKSAQRIANWNFDRTVEGFLAALRYVDSKVPLHGR